MSTDPQVYLLREAEILAEKHPSKDCRAFARSVARWIKQIDGNAATRVYRRYIEETSGECPAPGFLQWVEKEEG
jgi:hypothetical protein